MDVIICPTLLFISDEDWIIEEKQELFIDNLNKVLRYLSEKNVFVLWNDNLETLLWTYPELHPWFDVNNYAISELLHQRLHINNNTCAFIPCNSEPKINTTIVKYDITSYTLSLFHYLIANNKDVDFIVDKSNNHVFKFSNRK